MLKALHVTSCALLPVKIAYVTYKIEHAWSVNLRYKAVTLIYLVPSTVMKIHVTCRMEHVSIFKMKCHVVFHEE